MVKSRYIGDGHPTFNRNPYNGYINPYYWVDDHPLLYGNNGSLDNPDVRASLSSVVTLPLTLVVDGSLDPGTHVCTIMAECSHNLFTKSKNQQYSL